LVSIPGQKLMGNFLTPPTPQVIVEQGK